MKYKIYKTSKPKYFPSYLIAYSDKGDRIKAIKVHSGPLAKWEIRSYSKKDFNLYMSEMEITDNIAESRVKYKFIEAAFKGKL